MQLMHRGVASWRRIGPRLRDALLVAVAAVAALAEYVAPAPDGDRGLLQTSGLALALAAAATLWWRRRAPATVTTVGIVQVLLTHWPPVVMYAGLFSLAVRRRDRVLVAMTIAVVAATAVVQRVAGGHDWSDAVVYGLVLAGLCALAGSYLGARRDLLASLRDRAERAEQEREWRTEQAKLAERARIAREMHDVLAHKVSLIALHSGALEVNPRADPTDIERTAALVRTTAHEAMEDLRAVLGVLSSDGQLPDDDLEPLPRAADIERIVAASRAAGVHVELTMTVTDLPDPIIRSTYRVVREGLTNVHKHARGAATTVTVSGDADRGVTVEVVNRPPVSGPTLLPGSGVGLLGLRERVGLAGGTLHAGPDPDGGWRLTAWLPWSKGPPTTVRGAA